jgi:hypothetical protein
MKKLLAVLVLCVPSTFTGSVAEWPQGQGTAQIPISSAKAPAAPVQVAKLQDPAITKLQEQVVMLIDQDRQKTAQIGQLKYEVSQLQTQLTQFKTSVAQDYVPVAGPGNCGGGGWTGAVNVAKSPTALVYSWYGCKSQ